MERSKAISHILQVLAAAAAGILLVSLLLIFGPGAKVLFDKSSEKRFMTFKVTVAHAYDAVVLGDSRVYRGFDPATFETETGLRTLNLGFSSAGFSRSLFELAEHHLDPKGAKVILLSVTPFSMTEEAAKNEHLTQWVSRSRADLLSSRHLERFLIYLSPDAIKAVRGSKDKNPYHQTFYDNGFVDSRREFHDVGAGVRAYQDQFKREKVSERRVDGLIAQIEDWRRRGFTVLAYRPPAFSEVTKIEDETSGWKEEPWRANLQRLGVPWLRFEDKRFDSYDGSHLTGNSARDLTRQIAWKFRSLKP